MASILARTYGLTSDTQRDARMPDQPKGSDCNCGCDWTLVGLVVATLGLVGLVAIVMVGVL